MNTIIIDDEAKARKSIRELLNYVDSTIKVVAEADSVKTGFEKIIQYNPDLVLLDINMPDGSGFDLLNKLPSVKFKLIFITAYDEFAIKAFGFSAIDYILKPIDPLKLQKAIKRATESLEKENINLKLSALFSNLNIESNKTKKMVLNTEKKIHVIDTKNIIRCESDGGYTTFYMVNAKKILVSKNLKIFENMLLDCDFFRTHQSHLINLSYIDHYKKQDGGYIVMKNGNKIPIAQRKREQFLSILNSL